jgi:hypothetical protein
VLVVDEERAEFVVSDRGAGPSLAPADPMPVADVEQSAGENQLALFEATPTLEDQVQAQPLRTVGDEIADAQQEDDRANTISHS